MDLTGRRIASAATVPRLRWKRPLDLALAILLLLPGLPLIGLLALVVAVESPGPAFFRQERVGRHGRRFRIRRWRGDRSWRSGAGGWPSGCPSSATRRLPGSRPRFARTAPVHVASCA